MFSNEPNNEPKMYSDDTIFPVRYLPVMLRGEVVGYLWAAESGNGISFIRRMSSERPTFMAAAAWSERLDEAEARGMSPLEALQHWAGEPEDPEAGGIPATAEEMNAPDLRTLEERVNPGYEEPVDGEEDLLDEARRDRSEGWENLSPFSLERPGYSFLTDGSVRYLPATRGGMTLGYLWASETEDAAFFVKRLDAGVDGTYAEGKWITRLWASKKAGLSPIQALRHWVGEPEDPVAGEISAYAEEKESPSLSELEALANASSEEE